MAHAAWIAAAVVAAVAFFGVAILGMIGFTRSAYRLAKRRGWRESAVIAFTIAAGVLASLGGWLFYVCWSPFTRLFRPWPRLRIIGPVVGVIGVLVGGGAILNVLDPTTHPTWVNDTGNAVTISGCTNDPASFNPGARSSGPFVSTTARSCYVSFNYGDKPSGCLMLPRHVDGHTVIRLSDYAPTHNDCP